MMKCHNNNALFTLVLFSLILITSAACRHQADQNPPAPTSIPADRAPRAWGLSDAADNIGILVLDYQTYDLQRAYLSYAAPCTPANSGGRTPPLDDDTLLQLASGFFEVTGAGWPRILDESSGEWRLEMSLTRVGDLAVIEIPPLDFGGFAIFHGCAGRLLYAADIVWSGVGEQLYPAIPLPSSALQHTGRSPASPRTFNVVFGPGAEHGDHDGKGEKAWTSVRDLNLIQELAVAPYDVLVYLYPPSVGAFQPEVAHWVVFIALPGPIDSALWTPGAVTATPSPTATGTNTWSPGPVVTMTGDPGTVLETPESPYPGQTPGADSYPEG